MAARSRAEQSRNRVLLCNPEQSEGTLSQRRSLGSNDSTIHKVAGLRHFGGKTSPIFGASDLIAGRDPSLRSGLWKINDVTATSPIRPQTCPPWPRQSSKLRSGPSHWECCAG